MAIAVGSLVAVKNVSTPQQPGVVPAMGRVIGGSDPWNVLWDSGRISTGLAGTTLDEITPQQVDPAVLRFVASGAEQSPSYDCQLVASYLRGATQIWLLKALNAPAYFEAQATQIEAVASR